jgi:pimeloyl-ACP methyl ester carboxylesterase
MRLNLTVTLAVAILVSSTVAMASPPSNRPTYILVHGAFHGGWAWQKVADKLGEGARVYTPTLSGLGDRSHLARPEMDLATHVQDIVALIEFEDLHDVILVGHSYGGIVITGVAAAKPERIKKLVYFDAVVPEPGQSFFEAIAFGEPLPPDMWMMPSFPPQAFGLTEEGHIAFVGARLRAQPMGTFKSPLQFSWATLQSIPKAYIHCTGQWFARETFLQFRAKAQAQGWEYYEINDSHSAMLTSVEETHSVLRRLRN